jgi:hypothetical protein
LRVAGVKSVKLPANSNADGAIHCRERLGGVLTFYYRDAA